MIQTLPITKARQDLTILVNNAKKKLNEYIITVKGIPAAVLMSIVEYESLKETNEILTNPQLMKDIKLGEKDIKAGRMYYWEDVKKEFGLKTSQYVSDKTNRSSKKRT